MRLSLKRVRLRALSLAAVALQLIKLTADRLAGESCEIPNYTLLEPGLYLGGICNSPPPGTTAVLSLTPNRDAYSVEFHERQPILSGPVPSIAWLRQQVQFIDTHRRAGRTVFVHCDAGIDRSAMVVTAYFMWRDRLTREAALDAVQRKRPRVKPNPAFMELLTTWNSLVHAG